MAGIIVNQLTVYPVKALGGVHVEQMDLTTSGPAFDRRWMLATTDGGFITQRENPVLSHCEVEIEGDAILITYQESTLTLPTELKDGRAVDVRIWKDLVTATIGPPAAGEWFSRLLGRDCYPVFMPDRALREVNRRFAPEGHQTAFSDGFPVLLTTNESLADLNGRLDQSVPMSRFRPNIVVSGGRPFDEDRWGRVIVGDTVIRGVKPCSRCVVTTIDPKTLAMSKEPLKTLATFRHWGNHVYFGENFVVESEGTLRVGDEVEVDSLRTDADVAKVRV